MVIFNGKVYRGSVTIVNGQVVGDDSNDTCSDRTVDERKCECSDGIRRIDIRSNVPVRVSAESTCKNVEAHLHGSFTRNGNPKFSVTRDRDKIIIEVEASGMNGNNICIISSSSVVINNGGNTGGLSLEVMLPEEMFEGIFIESKNDKINVTESVSARVIEIKGKNGNVDVSATFQKLIINNKNGKIEVNSKAQSDIYLDVQGKNGNVKVSIGNIGTSKVNVESKNGNCKNNPLLEGRYTVEGIIRSKNGDVRFV